MFRALEPWHLLVLAVVVAPVVAVVLVVVLALRARSARRRLPDAHRDRGASVVEYALLVAAVAAVLVGPVSAFVAIPDQIFRHQVDADREQMQRIAHPPVASH